MQKKQVIVAITGASGSVYGLELIKQLQIHDTLVHLIFSDTGKKVFISELTDLDHNIFMDNENDIDQIIIRILQENNIIIDNGITIYNNNNFFTSIASGSCRFDAMVVIPCSMGTLNAIANGASDNLLERVADTTLKERRTLIIVARETPLNRIHLKNMLQLHDAGAIILPAMPAFYHKPQSLIDIVHFLVGKIMDQLKIDNKIFKRWKSEERQN